MKVVYRGDGVGECVLMGDERGMWLGVWGNFIGLGFWVIIVFFCWGLMFGKWYFREKGVLGKVIIFYIIL